MKWVVWPLDVLMMTDAVSYRTVTIGMFIVLMHMFIMHGDQ